MDEPRGQLDWRDDEQLRRIASVILREESLVDDVLQEAWLASVRRGPNGGDPERARLTGMVRHLALNLRRAERRRARRERAASKREPLESTSEVVARRSVIDALAEAIDQLEQPLQAPVRLHYLAGLEVKQVAAQLERPVPTIRDQLRRGVERLRERLRGRFGDSSALGLALIAAFDWDEREVVQSLRSSGWTSAARWIAGGILAGASLLVLARLQPSPSGEGRTALDTRASAGAVEGGSLPPLAVAAAESRNPEDPPEASFESSGMEPIEVVHEPTLSLRVVDATGAPVAGATARIVHLGFERFEPVGDPSGAGITDPAGRTSIRLARTWLQEDDGYGEHWSVWVDAQGFARSEVHSVPSASAAAGEVQIELEHPEVVLEGRALDVEGAPLDSGWVALSQIDMPLKQFIPRIDADPMGQDAGVLVR